MSGQRWFTRLKELWGNGEEGEKRVSTFQKLVILAGVGAGIMIFSSFSTVQQKVSPNAPPSQKANESNTQEVFGGKSKTADMSMEDYESMYESELKDMLEKVVGVGDVSVMVNLDSSAEVVVEKDVNARTQTTKEVDKERATREINETTKDEKVVLVQGDQGEQPVIVKRVKPTVRGVLIVAKGAESMKVKALITDAVQKALHVEAYKISVLPKKD